MISRLVILFCALFAFIPDSIAQRPMQLVFDGPAQVRGDGSTKQIWKVRRSNNAAVGQPSLEVSAGSVKGPTSDGNAWVFEYTAPRIATNIEVSVSASAKSGRKTLRGMTSVSVIAPTRELVIKTSKGPFAIEHPLELRPSTSFVFASKRTSPEPPTVVANLGTVSALTQSADGSRWNFSYTSDVRYPHYVIVAIVSADGETSDWVSIPMFATPKLEITTEPRASIRVRVDGLRYGPYTSNGKGRVVTNLLVPPGVETALVVGVDRAGNSLEQELPLNPPPYPRLVLACPNWGKNNYVFVADAKGKPATADPIEITSSSGTASESKRVAAGMYRFSVGGAAATESLLTIEASVAGAKQRSACSRKSAAVTPSSFRVSLSTSEHRAGDAAISVAVEALFDDQGRHVQQTPKLTPSRGEATPPRLGEDGRYTSTWTLPADHQGSTEATLRAETDKAQGQALVALRASALATLESATTRKRMTADGLRTTTIDVVAKDAHGNLISGLDLFATATGSIGPFSEPKNGHYRATYRAPLRYSKLREAVVVTSGEVQATQEFVLWAATRPRQVAASVGYATNLGRLAGPALSLDLMQSLPVLQRRLSVGLQLGLVYGIGEQAGAAADETIDVVVRSTPLFAKMRFAHPLGPLSASASLGGGILWSETWTKSALTGTRVRTSLRPAATAGLGVALPLTRGRIAADIAYIYSDLKEDIARGNPIGLLATLGYGIGF